MNKTLEEYCYCGKPLHYRNPESELAMVKLVNKLGKYINVKVGKRTWKVPRHFISLHGIKATDLPKLGFEEIKEVKK